MADKYKLAIFLTFKYHDMVDFHAFPNEFHEEGERSHNVQPSIEKIMR